MAVLVLLLQVKVEARRFCCAACHSFICVGADKGRCNVLGVRNLGT